MTILLRSATDDDRNFILSSWLRNNRNARYFTAWDNDTYFSDAHGYQRVIKAILARPETTVTVACPDDARGQILGFAVTATRPVPTIHYVYVKQPFRRRGIARQLVEAALNDVGRTTITATQTCFGWPDLAEKFRLVFNPWA